jgi:hypothetical protein
MNDAVRAKVCALNDNGIQADSFSVEPHGVEIFRIIQHGTATLLWTSLEHAVRYLDYIQSKKLQANFRGM